MTTVEHSQPDEALHRAGARWRRVRLGQIGRFSASGIDKVSIDSETPVKMVNYTDVYGNVTARIDRSTRFMDTTAPPGKATEHSLRVGDALFTPSSETAEDIGWAAVVTEDLPGVVYSYHLARWRPSVDIDLGFLRYALNSTVVRAQLTRAAKGTTRQILTRDDFRSVGIALPSPREQRLVADYLDEETARIDVLIARKRELTALASESFRAQRAHLILRGLDPTTGAGSLPSEWQRPLLGVLIELHRGIDLPADSRDDGDIPVISSGGVSGLHSVAACRGPGVVTGRYGTIGEVFYVDGLYWPLNTTLYVSDFRGNHPRWVYHLLGAVPLEVDAAKSAVTGINRNVVGQLRVVRPPLAEQVGIAAALDDRAEHAARTVRSVERQVELLLERRQALITAAVTGQLQIPGVAA